MSNPKQFKALLQKYGVTQARLALECNVSEGQISKVVNSPASQWGSRGFISKFQTLLPKALEDLGIPRAEFESLLPAPKPAIHQAPNSKLQIPNSEHPENEVALMDDNILAHFGLSTNPFLSSRMNSSRDLLDTVEHDHAVRRIVAAAENADLLLVTGEHGSGKTTAIRAAEPKIEAKGIVLCKFMASYVPKSETVIGMIIKAMYDSLELPDRRINEQKRITAIISALRTTNRKLAVLVDDGHTVHSQTLLAIKNRYDAIAFGLNQLCSFIIVTQPQMYSLLVRKDMAEFKGHIDRYEIQGLWEADIEKYIARKLRREAENNNCQIDRWIDPDAYARIWKRFAKAVPGLHCKDPQISPRHLNEICISLFDRAFELGAPKITAAIVDDFADRPVREVN